MSRHGVKDLLIIDKNNKVGGLSRTDCYDGIRYDVGPHRFFSKNEEVNTLWRETLGDKFRPVDRLTRIYYNNKYYNYPIKAFDALSKLGPFEAAQALFSYLMIQTQRKKEAVSFEEWVIQNFGYKLYNTFFKTYTEKVWGIPCKEIGAEWASQRIKGLDFFEMAKKAFRAPGNKNIKTLVEQFEYPILGAGQMYEGICSRALSSGGSLLLSSMVTSINRSADRIVSIIITNSEGEDITIQANSFFSSIPITHLIKLIKPDENNEIIEAAEKLYYRDHITVNLLIRGINLFPDQWIYVHDPEVKFARLANYNNFSKEMVNNDHYTALSVEYFVFQGDDLWLKDDQALQKLAMEELGKVGLISNNSFEKGWVVRETEAYPAYYIGFQKYYDKLVKRINEYQNLYSIGRGGMYKYNNQDHSIYSGMLAARNYCKAPGYPYDLWLINEDAEYLET